MTTSSQDGWALARARRESIAASMTDEIALPELTAQDHADIMARATGSRSVTYRVERRNADGSLTVLETATSSPR